MTIVACYMIEGTTKTYPTIAQALLAEVLSNCEGFYLENYTLDAVVAKIDKHFAITPRADFQEAVDETI